VAINKSVEIKHVGICHQKCQIINPTFILLIVFFYLYHFECHDCTRKKSGVVVGLSKSQKEKQRFMDSKKKKKKNNNNDFFFSKAKW
jgi:hypothetical protein